MAKKVAKKVTKKRVRKNVERGQAHIQSSLKVMLLAGQVPVVLVLEVQRNLLHMLHRWLLKQQQRLLLFTD